MEEVKAVEAEPYVQYEVKNYVDTKDRKVIAFYPLDPTAAEPKFVATTKAPVEHNNRKAEIPISVGLEGNTIQEAYETYDSCVEKGIKEVQENIKAEMNRPKIITPGMNNLPANMIQGNFSR